MMKLFSSACLLIIFSSCGITNRLREVNYALENNIEWVNLSSLTVQQNAEKIAENTQQIHSNLNEVAHNTETVRESFLTVQQNNQAIKENQLLLERTNQALSKNIDLLENLASFFSKFFPEKDVSGLALGSILFILLLPSLLAFFGVILAIKWLKK